MKLYILLLLAFTSLSIQAQDDDGFEPIGESKNKKETTKGGGAGFFTGGYAFIDNSALQAFLPAEVGDLSKNHRVFGGEGYLMVGRFMIVGSGEGISANVTETDSLKVQTSAGSGFGKIGIAIVNSPRTKLYPMIGLGGGNHSMRITENMDIDAADIATDPGREINISRGGFMLDFSLGFDYVLGGLNKTDQPKKQNGGWIIGIRTGYSFLPGNDNWSFSGGDLIGGPDNSLGTFYFKVAIGAGGFSK